MKKMLMILLLGMFFVSFVSAAGLTTINDKVEYDKDHDKYSISESAFLFFGEDPIKDVTLVENKHTLWTAWKTQEIVLHQQAKLFDDTD